MAARSLSSSMIRILFESATVAVHIRWLREKLEEDPAAPQFIKTVWGVGYQFDMAESQADGQYVDSL